MKMRNHLLKTYRVASLVFRHLAQLLSETLAFQEQPIEGGENFVTQPTYRLKRVSHKKFLGNLVHDFNPRTSSCRRTIEQRTIEQMNGATLARHKAFLARLLRTSGIGFKYVSTLQFAFALPIFVLKMSQISSAHNIFQFVEAQDNQERQYTPVNYTIRRPRHTQQLLKQAQSRIDRQLRSFSKIRRIQINSPVQKIPQEKSKALIKRIRWQDRHIQSAAHQLETWAFSLLTSSTTMSKILAHWPTSILMLPASRELRKISGLDRQSAIFNLEKHSAQRRNARNRTRAFPGSVTIPPTKGRFKDLKLNNTLSARREYLSSIAPRVFLPRTQKLKPATLEPKKVMGTKFTWLVSRELRNISGVDRQTAIFNLEKHSAQRRNDRNWTRACHWSVTIPSKEGRFIDLRLNNTLSSRREYLSAIAPRVSLLRTQKLKPATHEPKQRIGTDGIFSRRSRYASATSNIQEQTKSISREAGHSHTFGALELTSINSAKQSTSQKALNGFDTPTLIHPKQAQTNTTSKPVETSQTDRSNFPIAMVRPEGIAEPPGMRELQDIERLSDRVIRVIEERLKTEQERRGIFI